MKTQRVRWLDVVLLAPAMVYAGARLSRRPNDAALGLFIAAAGVGTFFYNLRNYQIEERRRRRKRRIRLRHRAQS